MDSRQLGQAVQAARKQRGLTQDALADQAGLAHSTLAKIERGAIKNPSVFTIQALTNIMGLTIEELLGLKAPIQTPGKPAELEFIYCDVNGVLVRFFQRAFTAMAADLDISIDRIEAAFWHFCDAVNSGQMTLKQYEKAWALRLGVKEPIDWKKYYFEAIEPIQPAHNWLTKAAKDYRVGLISNIFPGFLKDMTKNGLLPQLDYAAIIDSSEVRALKPTNKIYEAAEAAAGCPASRILLIDDTPGNLRAAEARKWRVFWFDDSRPKESVTRLNKVISSLD